MPKKLKVPNNCLIEIWVSDSDLIEVGCFAKNSVRLPENEAEYLSYRKSDGTKIKIPKYIEIDMPGYPKQRFYYFAQGTFNAAFRNFPVNEGKDPSEAAKLLLFPPAVFKLPFAKKEVSVVSQLDEPERHVRVFNECNKAALEAASKNSKKELRKYFFGEASILGNGVIEPYIFSEKTTSKEICDRLIKLYNEEQRIVVDSYVKNNLLTDKDGYTWIVDTGYALQLGSKDPVEGQQDAMKLPDPKSKASFCVWDAKDGQYVEHYGKQFLKLLFPTEYNQKFPPKKPEEIKKFASVPPELLLSMALLHIQEKYPEVKNVSCLTEQPALINYFAAAYIAQLRKKYFENYHEDIPALAIKKSELQILIDINEEDAKLKKLKEENIDSIEILDEKQAAQQDSLKTPDSMARIQVSPEGRAMPAQAASKSNTLLRTAQLREAKTAILTEIDKRIKQKPYATIPWLISSEAPIANIGMLRSMITQSKDLEDMENRLKNLMETQDVIESEPLTLLYQASLGAIQGVTSKEGIKKEGLKNKFDKVFKKEYGNHADKLVPLKTALEKEILHYINSAKKEKKTQAYQLIQDIHACKNEGEIIKKIDQSKIGHQCLINCCNIIVKPVFAKYPDDLKDCNNTIKMIALYEARIKADGAKKIYDETPAKESNQKLIAQLEKIAAELEYRKTLYKIGGAKETKSWWPWSINNKLLATEAMLKQVNYLDEIYDPKSVKSSALSLLPPPLPDTWASKEGKLGEIAKELDFVSRKLDFISKELAFDASAQSVSSRLSPVTVLAWQPFDIKTLQVLDFIHENTSQSFLGINTPFFNELALLCETCKKDFKNQQDAILYVLSALFPDENKKLVVDHIPVAQRAAYKIARLQQSFQNEMRASESLNFVIKEIRVNADSNITGIIDSLVGVDPAVIASIADEESSAGEVGEEDVFDEKPEQASSLLSTPVLQKKELPKHMMPSAQAVGADSESSDDEGIGQQVPEGNGAAKKPLPVIKPPSQQQAAALKESGMFFAPHHDAAAFEAAKRGIIQLLENKKLQGGAYPKMVDAIQEKKNATDLMNTLKEFSEKEKNNENLLNRLELCIIALKQHFPELKSPEESVSNKP